MVHLITECEPDHSFPRSAATIISGRSIACVEDDRHLQLVPAETYKGTRIRQECLCLTCEQRGRGFFSASTSASSSITASEIAPESSRRVEPPRLPKRSSRLPTPLGSCGSSQRSISPLPPDADRQYRHLILYEHAWPKRPCPFHPSTPDPDIPFDAFASALHSVICGLSLDALPIGRAEPDFVSDSQDSDDERVLLITLPASQRAAIAKMRKKDRARHLGRLRQERQARANGVTALFSDDEEVGNGFTSSHFRQKKPRLSPVDNWELKEVVLNVRCRFCHRIEGKHTDPLCTL